jgi:hypothetical protein
MKPMARSVSMSVEGEQTSSDPADWSVSCQSLPKSTIRVASVYPSSAPSIAPGTFFVTQSWADCITNMAGFNLRQAQLDLSGFRAFELGHTPRDLGQPRQTGHGPD